MNMEEKSTRRYLSFCKSLDNLKLSCGANPNENFVVVLHKPLILPLT